MKVSITMAAVFLVVTCHVQAGEWKTSWAQGSTEYQVQGEGQSGLYFSCNPDENTFVQFTDTQGKQISSLDEGGSVYASVDGKPSLLINDTFSDAGSAALMQFWKQLRTGKSVVITAEHLQSVTFSVAGASRVLPKFETTDCRVMQ
jgi:phage-related protein